MTLRPRGNYYLVERLDSPNITTRGGLYLPSEWDLVGDDGRVIGTEARERSQFGRVLATGGGRKLVKDAVQVGDILVLSKWLERRWVLDGQEVWFVSAEEALAVLEVRV
jgi:co-chaperonin GroES (HSP10)